MNAVVEKPDRPDVDKFYGGSLRLQCRSVSGQGSALQRRLVRLLFDSTESQTPQKKRRPQRDEWDKQIEGDLEDGKLDDLIEEAREDHRKGRTNPLPQSTKPTVVSARRSESGGCRRRCNLEVPKVL